MKNKSIVLPIVLLLCFSFGCKKQGDAAKNKEDPGTDDVRTEIEDGLQVVYNPKEPSPLPGMPKQIILEQELCIGDEEGIEDFVFSKIQNVQIDEDENIYVMDQKEVCVKVFDKDGNHLRTFGKKGQGPGEIQYPYRMQLFAGNEILIYCAANRRLSFYSLDGALIRELPIGQHNFLRTLPDSKGNIITQSQTPGDNKFVHEMIKFDMNLNPLLTIKTIEVEMNPYIVSMVNPTFNVRLMTNDYIAWGFPLDFKYEIVIFNPEGNAIRKIVKDYDPVKITAEDKEKITKDLIGDREVPPEYTLKFPKNQYPYWVFMCGDDGKIYARTFEQNEEGNFRYDVFDPEGRYIAKFYFSEKDVICLVRNNKLYSMVFEGAKGFPVVKRYDISWR